MATWSEREQVSTLEWWQGAGSWYSICAPPLRARSAIAFVEEEVRRLLSGRVSLHELIMTQGLWRVRWRWDLDPLGSLPVGLHGMSGLHPARVLFLAWVCLPGVMPAAIRIWQDTLGKTALVGSQGPLGPSPNQPPPLNQITGEQVSSAAAGDPAAAAEVRGPHASLAVRLVQRDPGRAFVLGERLPYVLLAGAPKQDDAAEDPVMAARSGARADYLLYWNNKLVRPLSEMLGHCMPPARVQVCLWGWGEGFGVRGLTRWVGQRGAARPGSARIHMAAELHGLLGCGAYCTCVHVW